MKSLLPSTLNDYQTGARAVGLKSVGALAISAAGLAALPSQADAQITVTHPSGPATASVTGTYFINFDVTTGVTSASNSAAFAVLGAYAVPAGDGVFSYVQGPSSLKFASNGNDLAEFGAGATVNSSFFANNAQIHQYNGGVAPGWAGTTGYMGFKDTLGDGAHYGWIEVTTNTDASSLTLDAFGFDTVPGQSVTAGEGLATVPEPAASAALLALGAAGLAAYRRRKGFFRLS